MASRLIVVGDPTRYAGLVRAGLEFAVTALGATAVLLPSGAECTTPEQLTGAWAANINCCSSSSSSSSSLRASAVLQKLAANITTRPRDTPAIRTSVVLLMPCREKEEEEEEAAADPSSSSRHHEACVAEAEAIISACRCHYLRGAMTVSVMQLVGAPGVPRCCCCVPLHTINAKCSAIGGLWTAASCQEVCNGLSRLAAMARAAVASAVVLRITAPKGKTLCPVISSSSSDDGHGSITAEAEIAVSADSSKVSIFFPDVVAGLPRTLLCNVAGSRSAATEQPIVATVVWCFPMTRIGSCRCHEVQSSMECWTIACHAAAVAFAVSKKSGTTTKENARDALAAAKHIHSDPTREALPAVLSTVGFLEAISSSAASAEACQLLLSGAVRESPGLLPNRSLWYLEPETLFTHDALQATAVWIKDRRVRAAQRHLRRAEARLVWAKEQVNFLRGLLQLEDGPTFYARNCAMALSIAAKRGRPAPLYILPAHLQPDIPARVRTILERTQDMLEHQYNHPRDMITAYHQLASLAAAQKQKQKQKQKLLLHH